MFFGPPPTDLPRTPHEPPFLMRFPAELLVLACLVVGIAPGLTVGPVLDTAVRAVLGPAIPEYSLAVWHGFTPELLMSVVAIGGGVAVYLMLRSYLLAASKGRRCCAISRGSGSSSACSSPFPGAGRDGWRSRSARGASSRNCSCWSCAALLAGLAPLYARGLAIGRLAARRRSTSPSRWSGRSASPARSGAAYQAKFHRLAALILLGGAGLVTCISFVWLSAPDLALTQLVVETVTTVLLLLGLRWLPKRIEQIGGRRLALSAASDGIALRDFAIARRCRSGLGSSCLCGHDPPGARQHFAASSSRTPTRKAAAPTS